MPFPSWAAHKHERWIYKVYFTARGRLCRCMAIAKVADSA